MVVIPSTAAVGASQQHTGWFSLLFLQVESFLQPELQRASTVGGRSIGNTSDVLFYKRNCSRVVEFRNQKFALHLHDLALAE